MPQHIPLEGSLQEGRAREPSPYALLREGTLFPLYLDRFYVGGSGYAFSYVVLDECGGALKGFDAEELAELLTRGDVVSRVEAASRGEVASQVARTESA